MAHIHLTTFIKAPAKRVFDLSRSITMHKKTMAHTNETAIAGTTHGLISKGETVTWQARHLFKNRLMRVKITEMKKHELFIDEQAEGDFKIMKHEHHFKPCENGTILIDLFHFESPYGMLGQWFNSIYLIKYMRRLLEQRNKTIKETAESDRWKKLLIK